MNTFETLEQTVFDILDFDRKKAPELSLDTKLKDITSDSLDMIEFIMMVEEDFDIEIADEDPEKWITLGDVVTYIDSRK